MKAVWNDVTLAKSDETLEIEGNHYFPTGSVRTEYLRSNDKRTQCPWKGQASYFDIVVNGKVNEASAWYYPDPKPAANEIKNYVAFWQGVEIRS